MSSALLRLLTLFALFLGLPALASAHEAVAHPCVAGLVSEEAMIPSDTPGISLYVRNKRPGCPSPDARKRVLLYVHGATYPSETAFDLPLDGTSWMDFIARHGWDVWLVDLRGYGRSTRPSEMDRPAAENGPIVDTSVAVRDVSAAADYIRAHTGVDKVTVLGWSWGTVIMGTYAATHPDKVNKVVLYAPVWLRTTPSALAGSGPLPAYRTVTKAAAKQRWLAGVPEDRKAGLIPEGWFDQWADATWATDPTSAQTGLLRAPNGVIQDIRTYWLSEKPSYDPSLITSPTLMLVAEWDQDTPPYMAQTLFTKLTSAPVKRLVLLGEGTHTIVMERNRLHLWREVQLFLDEE